MTRLASSALLSLAAAALFASPAFADPALYRAIDDQLFDVAAEARALRWDVAVAPIRENDRRTWLRGMDDIYDEITGLQKNLFRGRSLDHLYRDVDDLRDEIIDLREDLIRRGTPTSYRYERADCGTRFRCGVLPGGCLIPSNFVARLDGLQVRVDNLHALVSGTTRPAISLFPDRELRQPALGAPPVPGTFSPGLVPPLPQSPSPQLIEPSAPLTPYAVPLPAPSTSWYRPSKTERVLNTVDVILSQIR